MSDTVKQPSHYQGNGIEAMQAMDSMMFGADVSNMEAYWWGNAFKYLYRHKNKKGLEDVLKARWYLDKYIEMAEDKQYYGPESDALLAAVLADNGYPLDRMDEWAPPEGVLG